MNTAIKKGMRVRVFNQVSDNFTGIVRAINKKTARVEAEDKYPPFTNHPNARCEDQYERETFLVPFCDLTILYDAPSVGARGSSTASGASSENLSVPAPLAVGPVAEEETHD